METNRRQAFERLDRIAASLDREILDSVSKLKSAKSVGEQPWLVLGCSDGMGLNTTIAALEAGVLVHGLGVYWEPKHFLERNEDGTPVSPVHVARVENANALSDWARERYGANLDVVYANVILTPPRGLKGDPKGEISALPDGVIEGFERVRERAPGDAIAINSVAFGKWICPREGQEAITVPSVDFDGRLVGMSTKGFHPKGYEETLDTMGRNHLALLHSFAERGWLGADSLTAFFTWAGGSQNVASLEGIYGRGALGDAKIIAERDVARFRMDHPIEEYGAHAIVRLPAFLSAALMGIPGGGLFGLVSRRVLEQYGEFEDMPTLSSKMIRGLFGPEWVRENPISQIELDLRECLRIDEISAGIDRVHRRIDECPGDLPFDVVKSAEILHGLVPTNYQSVLARFKPGEGPEELETTLSVDDVRWGLDIEKLDLEGLKGFSKRSEEIRWLRQPTSDQIRVTYRFELDGDTAAIEFDGFESGDRIVHGSITLGTEIPALPLDPLEVGAVRDHWEIAGPSTLLARALADVDYSGRTLEASYGDLSGSRRVLSYVDGDASSIQLTLIDQDARVLAKVHAH